MAIEQATPRITTATRPRLRLAPGRPASIDLSWRFGVARFSEKPHTFALAEVGRQTADASRDRLAATGLRRLLLVSDKPDRKLSLGRGIYRTGVGIRGTYNIDSLAGPVDHIRYRGKVGFWGTEGVLDVAWWTDMNQGQRNYVLTKRLEMSLSPELEFSISDTARTRAVTSPFYLISPLSLWTSLLRDRVFGDTTVFEDDNVMNHAELYWVASDALHLYADAAIDEVDLALVLDTVRCAAGAIASAGRGHSVERPERQGSILLRSTPVWTGSAACRPPRQQASRSGHHQP